MEFVKWLRLRSDTDFFLFKVLLGLEWSAFVACITAVEMKSIE